MVMDRDVKFSVKLLTWKQVEQRAIFVIDYELRNGLWQTIKVRKYKKDFNVVIVITNIMAVIEIPNRALRKLRFRDLHIF